jgi:hypothetical protein
VTPDEPKELMVDPPNEWTQDQLRAFKAQFDAMRVRPLDLAAIRKRLAETTSGPWHQSGLGFSVVKDNGDVIVTAYEGYFNEQDECAGPFSEQELTANLEFIAEARQDVPALLRMLERALALIVKHEWCAGDEDGAAHEGQCPECDGEAVSRYTRPSGEPSPAGHTPDCEWGRIIAEARAMGIEGK